MEEHRRWQRVLVPTLLVGTAALLMLWGVGTIDRIVFDEVYYVNDARDFLERGVEEGFVVHPPLAKQLIALSIWALGDTAFAWRAAGAVAGAVTVLLVYLIGRRLFDRVAPAALAAFLVAVDGVFLVQARTAMLDIFLAFFVVLGVWALVVDRDRVRSADAAVIDAGERLERMPPRDRRFLALAGVALGAAVAVKWSGALALGGAGLATIGFELARRRRLTGRWFRSGWRGAGLIATTLVVLPVATYAVTWIPWFANFESTYQATKVCDDVDDCSVPLPSMIAALGDFHVAIAEFHTDLEVDHSYRAAAYTWPIQARPVVYYYETCSEDRYNRVPKTNDDGEEEIPEPCRVERGDAAEMLAVGNPALWWLSLPAAAIVAAAAVRRDRRVMIPALFALVQWLPWLVQSRPAFSFYAVPLVPFVALGVAGAVARWYDRLRIADGLIAGGFGAALGALGAWIYDLAGGDATRAVYGLTAAAVGVAAAAAVAWRDRVDRPASAVPSRSGRWALAAIALIAAGLAIFFLPVWVGLPMSEGAVKLRWWFRGWI